MPKERLSMRKIREVLRLRYDRNMSQREIGQACSMGRSTVSAEYLERARVAGISWPVNHLSDEELEETLFYNCQSAPKESGSDEGTGIHLLIIMR